MESYKKLSLNNEYTNNHSILNTSITTAMKTISSRQNPEIIAVAALATSKERSRQGMFMAEGLRTCTTLIKSPLRLAQLYITEPMVKNVSTLVNPKLITIVSDPVMEKISQTSSSAGIVGVFHIPQPPLATQLKPGLVLDHIADPGNMGTLIRTCVALNIESVVIIGGADVWSPKVIQATVGTIGHVTIFNWSHEELIANKGTMPLSALIVKGGKAPSADYKNSLLVVGNEAHGISPELLTHCHERVTIPMPGNAESLNAAVAGSLALYLIRLG